MSMLSHLESQGRTLGSKIRQVAESLEKHQRNVKIARLVGSLAAVIGAVVAVIGEVAAARTGGVSRALVGIGMMLSSSGRLLSTGATIADEIIEICNLAALQKEWDAFILGVIKVIEEIPTIRSKPGKYKERIKTNVSSFFDGVKEFKNSIDQLKKVRMKESPKILTTGPPEIRKPPTSGGVGKLNTISKLEEVGLKESTKRLSTDGPQFEKAAKDGGLKNLGKPGEIRKDVIYHNLASIPIDFIDVVKVAVDLGGDQKSEICGELLKLADLLEEGVKDLIQQ